MIGDLRYYLRIYNLKLKDHKYHSLIYIMFTILVLSLPYSTYLDRYILGGETDNTPINLDIIKKNALYIWNDKLYAGSMDSLHFVDILPQNLFYILINLSNINLKIQIRLYLFFLHLLTFLGVFLLAHKIFKKNYPISWLVAFLYSYTFYYFSQVDHQFQLLSSALAPFLLLITIDYLEKPEFKKIIIANFLFLFLFLASVHSPPSLIIATSLPLFFIIYNLFYQKKTLKVNIINSLKFISLSIFIFALFNIWWLVNFIIMFSKLNESASNYVINTNWLVYSSPNKFIDVFRNLGYWPWKINEYVSFQHIYYDNFVFIITSFIMLFFVVFSFLLTSKNKYLIFFRILFISVFFFIMGPNFPILGDFFIFLYENIPEFNTFQNTYYKFSWIYSLASSFLIGFFLCSLKNRKTYISSFLILILCNFLLFSPFIFGWWIVKESAYGSISAENIPNEYFQINEGINSEKTIARLIDYPQSQYNYFYDWGAYFTSLSQRIFNIPQLFISPGGYLYSGAYAKTVEPIYKDIDVIKNDRDLMNGLRIFNVKYVFVDNTIRETELYYNSSYMLDILGKNRYLTLVKYLPYNNTNNPNLKGWYLYKINSSYFLPHFYTPQTIILINQNTNTIYSILSEDDYKVRPLIYFKNQSHNINNIKIFKNVPGRITKAPVLEFKKINPTKYRVIVHSATDSFPLVFSESFHDGWKAYLVELKEAKLNLSIINNYKILEGNEEDQATKKELLNFIKNGWVTLLGDGKEKQIEYKKWENNEEVVDHTEKYYIDFISKNFQDTIQNDNLPNGEIYETWFIEPIENNENHLIANGYANSWIIDPTKLCDRNSKCIKNPDGSYDFEIVVEFWSQRLYYIGLIISGIIYLICIGYLFWDWRKTKVLG